MVLTIIYSEEDLTKTSKVVCTAFSIFTPDTFGNSTIRCPKPEEVAISQIFPLIRRKCKQSPNTTKENYCFCNTARCTVVIG